MDDTHITKSLFTVGQRCRKALYLNKHSPHLKPPITSLERKTLEAGKVVGHAARKSIPNGVLIKSLNTSQALHETQQAIEAGALTLFEAAFSYNNVLIRVDILSRKAVDTPWDFYEVKATTYNNCTNDEKNEYREDISIQIWVLQKLGMPLRGIFLMHLNRECRYPDLNNLFVYKNYSSEILDRLSDIDNHIDHLKNILSLEKEPDVRIGPHCDKPRMCPFTKNCQKHIPKPSIFNIPRNSKKWDQYEQGIISTDDIKMSEFNTEMQKRTLKCYQDNRPFFDKKVISELLGTWEYPLAYLDFEAIDHAIPRYPGARPYQHIPFQFSCHIQRNADADLEHAEFLWTSADDPRPAFIHELIGKVPSKGSIVVYYAPYESTRLKELAEDFPKYADQLNDIKYRLVDLMAVIQKGVYYPEFMGSFSIKKVAPAILGENASYAGLGISDGIQAMLGFEEMIKLLDNTPERKALRNAMLEYCKQDTMLMAQIHQWLQDQMKTA